MCEADFSHFYYKCCKIIHRIYEKVLTFAVYYTYVYVYISFISSKYNTRPFTLYSTLHFWSLSFIRKANRRASTCNYFAKYKTNALTLWMRERLLQTDVTKRQRDIFRAIQNIRILKRFSNQFLRCCKHFDKVNISLTFDDGYKNKGVNVDDASINHFKFEISSITTFSCVRYWYEYVNKYCIRNTKLTNICYLDKCLCDTESDGSCT